MKSFLEDLNAPAFEITKVGEHRTSNIEHRTPKAGGAAPQSQISNLKSQMPAILAGLGELGAIIAGLQERVSFLECELKRQTGLHWVPQDSRFETMLSRVAMVFETTPQAIRSHGRTRELCCARFVVYYLGVRVLGLTQNRVGKFLERDHGTIGCGIKELENQMEQDNSLRLIVDKLRASLEKGAQRGSMRSEV